MSTDDDIDALAGEYVLGTLDQAERASVAVRRHREPALDRAIREWEMRLAPLDATTPEVAPPAGLLQRIEQAIEGKFGAGGGNVIELASLRRSVAAWRQAAVAASSIAAALLLVIGLRETVWREPPQTYVGVFQKDDVLPSFYLTIDLAKRELTIRPVDAKPLPGRVYQLWIASDQLGPVPRSLGLVDDNLAPTTKLLINYEPQLLQRATFGVSIEPTGGSPTGRPSPGALHTKLLPVVH